MGMIPSYKIKEVFRGKEICETFKLMLLINQEERQQRERIPDLITLVWTKLHYILHFGFFLSFFFIREKDAKNINFSLINTKQRDSFDDNLTKATKRWRTR